MCIYGNKGVYMEIIVGNTSGFCYGVKNAVEGAEKELKLSNQKTYCLGELVHNKTVTDKLEKDGIVFINDIKEANGKTIIRAHGIEKNVYVEAKKRNIELIDLTCPNVLKIHDIVEKYSKNGYYIFLIGKKEHPEIIGTYSFSGKQCTIISKKEETEKAVQSLEKTGLKNLLIISQTTYNLQIFEEIVNKIKQDLEEKNINIEIKNTICKATELRQKETEKISKEVDVMIIVGGKNSSNTTKLYDISNKNCQNVIFVQNSEELDIKKIKNFEKIGIMAGASTPKESIDEIIKKLEVNTYA